MKRAMFTREEARRAVLKRELLKPVIRWVPSRKCALIEAINAGVLSAEDAMAAHSISADELGIWRENLRRGGIPDLRLKSIQARPDRPFVTPASTFHPVHASA